jgi:hypothetical protein
MTGIANVIYATHFLMPIMRNITNVSIAITSLKLLNEQDIVLNLAEIKSSIVSTNPMIVRLLNRFNLN